MTPSMKYKEKSTCLKANKCFVILFIKQFHRNKKNNPWKYSYFHGLFFCSFMFLFQKNTKLKTKKINDSSIINEHKFDVFSFKFSLAIRFMGIRISNIQKIINGHFFEIAIWIYSTIKNLQIFFRSLKHSSNVRS